MNTERRSDNAGFVPELMGPCPIAWSSRSTRHQWAVGEKRLKIPSEAENKRADTKAIVAVARDLGIHRAAVSDLMPTA
jgi:hypothetical protein